MGVIAVPAAGSQMWSTTQTHAHMVCLTSSQHMLNVIGQWSWTLVKTRRKKKGRKLGERGWGFLHKSRLPLNSNVFKVGCTHGCGCKRWKRLHTSIMVYAAVVHKYVRQHQGVCERSWAFLCTCVSERWTVAGWNTLQMVKCVWCGAERERRKRPNASQLGNTSMRNTGTPSRYNAAPPSSQASDRSKQSSSHRKCSWLKREPFSLQLYPVENMTNVWLTILYATLIKLCGFFVVRSILWLLILNSEMVQFSGTFQSCPLHWITGHAKKEINFGLFLNTTWFCSICAQEATAENKAPPFFLIYSDQWA